MEAYKVDGIILGFFGDQTQAVIERELELMEAMDSILYKHFELALAETKSEFQITINDVLIDSKYEIKDGRMLYTATRQDNKFFQFHNFLVDLSDVDNCELSDDINEARTVTLWLLEAHESRIPEI